MLRAPSRQMREAKGLREDDGFIRKYRAKPSYLQHPSKVYFEYNTKGRRDKGNNLPNTWGLFRS